jgi:hypothetical protein
MFETSTVESLSSFMSHTSTREITFKLVKLSSLEGGK